jgi:hypothetical protein
MRSAISLLERPDLPIQKGDVLLHRMKDCLVGDADPVELLGTHGEKGIDPSRERLQVSDLGRKRCLTLPRLDGHT